MSAVPDALGSSRAIFRSLQRAADGAARGVWHCTAEPYVQRMRESSTRLRLVLAHTPADWVTSVVVPASGGDVHSAMAAFPRAEILTLLSIEPATPTRSHALRALATNQTAIALLSAIFACSHGGAYFVGIQLVAFTREWGMLPVLLTGLQLQGVDVLSVTTSHAPLPGATIVGCRPPLTGSARIGCRRVRIRYIQTSLRNASTVPTVLSGVRHYEQRWGVGATQRSRGLFIKSAEVALRGGDDAARMAQDALSEALLKDTDVLLQDTQSSIRWTNLEPWVLRHRARMLPLGQYIGPEESLYPSRHTPSSKDQEKTPAATPTARASRTEARLAEEARAELEYMRGLWEHSPRWRSLDGHRFGYCHSSRHLSAEMLAGRRPMRQEAAPSARGEADVNERSAVVYCAALLAWREHAPTRGDSLYRHM
jgi:hypothetical protein